MKIELRRKRPDLRDLYNKRAQDAYAANQEKKWKCQQGRRLQQRPSDESDQGDRSRPDHVAFTLSEPLVPESLLGQGTYGQVYLCNWLGSKLALKVPHRSLEAAGQEEAQEPDLLDGPVSEAFRCADLAREHAIMTQLAGHPNIVHVFQLLRLPDGCVGMLMEVAASHLQKHCLMLKKSDEPWSDIKFQVWKLFKQVLAGLAHIQAKKVVHCDLKTNNTLFLDGGRAAIADFGLSRSVTSSGQVAVYGNSVYTIGYRPLECLVAGGKRAWTPVTVQLSKDFHKQERRIRLKHAMQCKV